MINLSVFREKIEREALILIPDAFAHGKCIQERIK
jgi:hypothetical protein